MIDCLSYKRHSLSQEGELHACVCDRAETARGVRFPTVKLGATAIRRCTNQVEGKYTAMKRLGRLTTITVCKANVPFWICPLISPPDHD